MKILFLSPWFPYPPVNGSKICIYILLKSLGSHHSIELLSFVRGGEQVEGLLYQTVELRSDIIDKDHHINERTIDHN